MTTSRRDFLRSSVRAGLVMSAAGWGGLPLWRADGADGGGAGDLVALGDELEPLARLMEETPRERCVEMLADQLRKGTGYGPLLSALFLAGIRNVNPQPPGFKFHCVFAIHAAHQLSASSAAGEDRWMPLFWALDEFKQSQEQDARQGDFRLRPVSGHLPEAGKAWAEFHEAMEAWDEERADRAVTMLARSRGAHEVIGGLWKYGARDYRNIGHKAIFVANAWRTLETIGWEYAEPVLRSLVLGLLDFKEREVNGYAFKDQCYGANAVRAREWAGKLPPDWTLAGGDSSVTGEVLEGIRSGDVEGASEALIAALAKRGRRAGAAWDAVHLAAGELMMRQPGVYGIHTVTSSNALHYAFRQASDPGLRLLLLLQGVGWMGQFHKFMGSRPGGLGAARITALEGAEIAGDPKEAVAEIFAGLPSDPAGSAAKALAYGARGYPLSLFGGKARELIFTKQADAHHYKYATAILEDYRMVSREWRPRMLATSVYYLKGSQDADSALMRQAREALL